MELLKDTFKSISRPGLWAYTTSFQFLMRYRRTFLGPLWIILGPLAFIGLLGFLFSSLSNNSASVFIPHLAMGLVIWKVLGDVITRGHNLLRRNRGFLLQGKARLTDIVMMDATELVLHFFHQCIIIVFVVIYYNTLSSWYGLVAIPGFLIIMLNAYLLTVTLALLGARFHDLGEFSLAFIRIAFLATPIIWMPNYGDGLPGGGMGRGEVLGAYLFFNPFYHFMELVRSPLSDRIIPLSTWYIVAGLTAINLITASVLYQRTRHMAVIWTIK